MTSPPAKSDQIRARLSRQPRRDTKPELALRRELHARGFRFFVDRKPVANLRSRADVVFPRRKVAIFVDGCFWHSCTAHGTLPKSNTEWWTAKLIENQRRDAATSRSLIQAGWTVLRFWEHIDPKLAANLVEETLTGRARIRDSSSSVRSDWTPYAEG